MTLLWTHIDALIDLAFTEDVGPGDLTTELCIDATTQAKGILRAKEPLIVSGTEIFQRVFQRLDPSVTVKILVADGTAVDVGTEIAHVTGSARSLLVGERPALNFIMRLSGVATMTRAMVESLHNYPHTRLVDTRKTTPGWRMIEKAAVRHGGGHNHRVGLFDGILIKDNHIKAAGGIASAVKRARMGAHHFMKIEVEVSNFDEVREALAVGADILLLDNMNNETTKEALAIIRQYEKEHHRQVIVEASGNMTFKRLPEVAALGVDLISMGALTHGARSVDLSMKIQLLG